MMSAADRAALLTSSEINAISSSSNARSARPNQNDPSMSRGDAAMRIGIVKVQVPLSPTWMGVAVRARVRRARPVDLQRLCVADHELQRRRPVRELQPPGGPVERFKGAVQKDLQQTSQLELRRKRVAEPPDGGREAGLAPALQALSRRYA